MKRALAILLTAMMLLSMVPTAAFAEEYDSEQLTEMSAQPSEESSNPAEGPAFNGQGSEEEPYEIDSEDSLKLLATLVNEGSEEYAGACYILTADICLTEAWTPIGSTEYPFCGSFDGNGKKIAGLSADSGVGCFGLFGAAKNAELFGIALDDVNIEASGYDTIGAVVGYMQGGSLSESYAEGTVNGDSGKYCGGLAGCAEGAEIVNCFSAVEMTAAGYVGGIAGFGCGGTTIDHCYNIGFIYSTVKGAFGSVLGNTGENIDLSDCYCIDTTDKGAVFLSREEAADKNSFKGFDFDGVWFVDNSSGYPYPVLTVSPSKCDAKWAPDTTEYEKGYVDNEEHKTSLSKNAMLESNSKDADTYASYYVIPNLPAVRNQSPYGTCWAHSILAAAETNLIKKGYADSSVNLSELQFVWFHHNGTLNAEGKYEDPLNNFGGDRNYSRSTSYGAWGGDNYYAASKSAASWMGLINEDETTAYSKTNAENIVANGGLDYSYAFSKDAYHLENVKMIPANSGTDAVKKALLKYGAISFSYMAEDGYTTSNGKYYYSSLGTDTDHAVCIVGWDDKISKDLFYDENNDAVPKNDGAWIVRNSWGSSWGDGGYFYMSYESSFVTTSKKNLFAFDFEKAENYEKCYQYDGSSYTFSSGFSSKNPAAANIFTASGNDIISAVSFWMEDNSDLNYTVKIYTNITDGSNPTSGKLAASVSGQTDYAGYYTVALPNPVSVSSGTKFSVVLQITNSTGETIYFPRDYCKYYDENDYHDAYSSAGQSFLSSDGVNWTDKSANNGGNYRIKAFTADNTNDPRPLAPTVSVSTANGKMALSWNSVNNAAGYTVYRALTSDGSYSQVGTTTSTSYTDTTAVKGTVYYYRVTAKSTGGNVSRYSNTASGLIGTQTAFIVSYSARGGTEAPAYQVKTAGTALTLSEEIPYRKNYTFLGWSEDSSAKTADYAPGDSFTKDADTTLYAVWFEGILVNSPDKLESDHDYANGMDVKWYFTSENAASISLTFDSQTYTEKGYDYIYIYDGGNNEIGKYSGNELAEKTVKITGDTVCIRLTSDGSYNYYGFKVSSYEIEKNTQYTVKFVNEDGTELQSGSWNVGATPSYTGATPTKASTAQYSYTFTGWSPAISAVTEDVTYIAQYSSTVRQYTVTFKNDDGTVLKSSKLDYGATPSYTGATPTKASTAQYSYTFTGWSPAIVAVTGDVTYTAQYNSTVRQYTVKFVNGSSVLQTNVLNYGATPSYTGATPTKAENAQYSYSFKGWSPAISTVTGDVTYTAQFKETVKQYTLTINYVSADSGFTAPKTYTADVNYGASYSKASPSVTGYVCDNATVSGTMGTGATVTVTYYKVGFTWNGTSAVVNAGSVINNAAATVNSAVTTKPTCTVMGKTTYTASYTAQGQTFTAKKTLTDVSAINHANKVHHSAAAATCLAAGNIEYYYCPDCQCYFTANMTATTAEAVVIAKLNHEYEFASNTAAHTITATCKNGCYSSEVLTLTAPENAVYDGNAKTATADKTTLGGKAVSSVSYYVKNAQGSWASVNEAVNAGSYKAAVSVGGVTTEYTFTIKKLTPEISLSCADIERDGAPAPEYEVKGSTAAPVITYSADGVSYGTWDEVKGSADTYYVKAYIAATDNTEEAVAVASFNISSGCAHISIISIKEGRYLLYLNEVQVGYVTLTQKDGKWAINVEGKGYISYDGSKISYSSTPYYWTHNGTGFTVVKSETTGVIFKRTKSVTYYLSYGGESVGYSLTKDATISVIMDIVTGEQHKFAYRDNGDGTHTKYCTVCGKEYATTACTYDESTHCCRYCGHADPSVKSVKANVTVNKTYNSSAWTRFWHGDYTYNVSINATANGDTVKSVQYSTNGSKWTTGTSFSQYKDVGTLYVRVTTGSGDTYNFKYSNGTTVPVT